MRVTFHVPYCGDVVLWMPGCCEDHDVVEKARELGALMYTPEVCDDDDPDRVGGVACRVRDGLRALRPVGHGGGLT